MAIKSLERNLICKKEDIICIALNLLSGVSVKSGSATTQLASYNWFADGSKNSELCARKLSPATSLL